MALVVSVAMGLGMTACGGGTIGFMWVLGTQYNQIAGFKIDDFTGNLTAIPHSPFTSGGANPVSIVVKPGGRFVYVVNKGGGNGPAAGLPCGTAGSISEFSVGGQGILTFQQCFQSQGTTPVWAANDSTGNFLYVLDQVAKDAICDSTLPGFSSTSCYGSITVFSIDPNTGRLTLVLNQQVKAQGNTGLQQTYFAVGQTPTMMAVSGGCLFTLNTADQTVSPYAVGTAGQLTFTTTQKFNSGAVTPTSIIAGGSGIYITDAGAPNQNSPGQVLPYTVGAATCSLNTITGGAVANIAPAANPVYSLVEKKTSTHLYVLNQSTTDTTNPNSSISAFTIQTNSTLQELSDPGNNPYTVGAGPVCMAEDPSNQYVYTSNGDGTVTGKQISTLGQLSDLRRGSKFTATGQATCLAISGNVD
ncbi:beta-propeller fold lactonase family protein [Granulicella sp. S190]|uniref:beta-propeller fold lactonase family protein n=1 Tax=Granulicella sp. S190 TaxID=1747226 RepID=UPI00131C09DF|nr:beta-propeller fold lactonase family protein [Granulicella sp. S190]